MGESWCRGRADRPTFQSTQPPNAYPVWMALVIPNLSPDPEKRDTDYPRIPASAPNGLRPHGLLSLQEVSPEPSQAWARETWERRHGVNYIKEALGNSSGGT